MNKLSSQIEFDAELAKNPVVLALFYSSWCPYCKRFLPVFDETVAHLNVGTVIHVLLDDDNPLWEAYGISAVPTLIYFKDGVVKNRLDARLGLGLSVSEFEQWIKIFPQI